MDTPFRIARQKQPDDATQYSLQFLKTVLDSVSDAISIVDVNDFRIVGANRAFLKLYNLPESKVLGRKCYELTHHRDTPCEGPDDVCPFTQMLETGEHSVSEHVHYGAGGERMYVEVTAYPILDDKGNIVRAVHLGRNITQRKRTETQLHLRVQELQALNNMFQQRFSAVSAMESACVSMATSIGELSLEMETLVQRAQSQGLIDTAALVQALVALQEQANKLASQAQETVSRAKHPPAGQ